MHFQVNKFRMFLTYDSHVFSWSYKTYVKYHEACWCWLLRSFSLLKFIYIKIIFTSLYHIRLILHFMASVVDIVSSHILKPSCTIIEFEKRGRHDISKNEKALKKERCRILTIKRGCQNHSISLKLQISVVLVKSLNTELLLLLLKTIPSNAKTMPNRSKADSQFSECHLVWKQCAFTPDSV